MEYKKEVLAVLEEQLQNKLKMLVSCIAEKRAADSQVMQGGSRVPQELLSVQTKLGQTIKTLEVQLRHLRDVIKEVKNDTLEV